MIRERARGRRALGAVLVAGGAAALAATAAPGAADTQQGEQQASDPAAGNAPPVASLRIAHRRVRVGRRLVLDASRSRDPDGRIVRYLWDLNGDGVYERDTGHRARVRHTFRRPRRVRVAVVVIDDEGAYDLRHARVRVTARSHESRPAKDRRAPRARPTPTRVRAATATEERRRPRTRKATARSAPAPVVVRAASSSGAVTIKDYSFNPKSLTVHVGDTVVWTNQGPSGHSATAYDGSFDTGVLNKGSSGSFKFDKAGTFRYHCTPHPFMKASITVTGSGGSSSSTSSAGSNGSGGSGGSGSSSHHSSLPHTGLEIGALLLAGLALLGAGVSLRRRLTRL